MWERTDDRPIEGRRRVPVRRQGSGEEGLIEVIDGKLAGPAYQDWGTETVRILDPDPEVAAR